MTLHLTHKDLISDLLDRSITELEIEKIKFLAFGATNAVEALDKLIFKRKLQIEKLKEELRKEAA